MRLCFLILLLLLCGAATRLYAEGNTKSTSEDSSQQTIWWEDDQLVKDAIISSLVVAAAHPNLMSDERFAEHLSDVEELVLLFDSMSSDRSVNTLASLSPYYLGEASSEMYACLVVRKRERIRQALLGLLSSKKNECIDKYGNSVPSGIGISVCLPDGTYRRNLKQYLKSIDERKKCTIEQ